MAGLLEQVKKVGRAMVGIVLSHRLRKNRADVELVEVIVETAYKQMIAADQFNAVGQDAPPLRDDYAVVLPLKNAKGRGVLVAYVDIKNGSVVEAGENLLYSRDSSGAKKAQIYLREKGIAEINNGSDFAVRFSALETAYNELQQKFNTHVHPGVSEGNKSTVSTITPSLGNIALSKVDNVKVP